MRYRFAVTYERLVEAPGSCTRTFFRISRERDTERQRERETERQRERETEGERERERGRERERQIER